MPQHNENHSKHTETSSTNLALVVPFQHLFSWLCDATIPEHIWLGSVVMNPRDEVIVDLMSDISRSNAECEEDDEP